MGASQSAVVFNAPRSILEEKNLPSIIEVEEPNEDQEIEDALEERRRILQDCKALKQRASFHLHPERPVVTQDPSACARCYFDRPSAPQQESFGDLQEHVRVLEECVAMRTYADFFLHPAERPVVVKTTAEDPTAFARNYFTRPSAVPQMSLEETEEKSRAMEDALIFQQYAKFHLHPERRVITTDPAACGRNYFDRPSAIPQETPEELKERDIALKDVELIKTVIRFHMHPELPVVTTDPTACGRNYFGRASAPEQETAEEMKERDRIMEEIAALKMHARFHLHPELPVETTDSTATARCYFDRFHAPGQETKEEMDEQNQALEEIKKLKMYARFHLHPELPVVTTEPAACERNFFDRISASKRETPEEAEERHQILEDAAYLEDSVQIMHTSHVLEQDYFDVVTKETVHDVETESSEDAEAVLDETSALKMFAKFHLHPELPVKTTDPSACERSFFDRASALEQESPEEAEERHQVLQDAARLEEYAQMLHTGHTLEHDYFHDGHFVMDEDMNLHKSSSYFDADLENGSTQMKLQEEGSLSRSPSGVFEFA